MIMHPCLQVASRAFLDAPKLVFLGALNLDNEKATTWQEPDILASFERPEEFSLEQANAFLRHGYHPRALPPSDPRITNGEFCMLFEFTDETKTKIERCIKVTSDAYDWRVRMRANDPDLRHLTFNVASIKNYDVTTRNGYQQYTNRYLSIALPQYTDLPYLYPLEIPKEEIIGHQRETAVASLVFASPPWSQSLILQHFAEYLNFMHACTEWIMVLAQSFNPGQEYKKMEQHPFGPHAIRRIQNMIEASRKRLQNALVNESEYWYRFRSNIQFFVENEYGESLHKIFRVAYGL
jgi:hypothetical protein